MTIKQRWWVLFAAALVLAVGLTATQYAASGAPSRAVRAEAPAVTQQSLGPAYVTAGASVKASLSVTSSACVTASRIGVAVRSASGANLDFPAKATGVQLCPAGYAYTSGARTFTPGSYQIFGAWQGTDGVWHNLPAVTLTVGAAPVPPTPTPTPTVTATGTPAGTGPSWDASGSWTRSFTDEFTGTALDTAKWTPGWGGTGITGPVNTAETACYSSSNVSVSGGLLHLRLAAQANTCRGSVHPLTGAHVNTDGKYAFGPRAAVEYRAYFPASADGGVANWPALWDDGQSWPGDGENDTAEGLGGQLCTNFWGPSGDTGADCHGHLTGWHTVGYSWNGGVLKWYYDGALVTTKSTSVTSPHYLIMQNTQGEWGGQTLTPSDLQVDWVRVWK